MTGFTKLSILFLYRRIFRGRVFGILSSVLGWLIAAFIIAFFFEGMFQCKPISSNWGSPMDMMANCVDQTPSFISFTLVDLILDALLLCFPLPLVMKLQMPTARKLAVMGMFMLGAL